ncbi:di-trans,poly-cis-decaprenylcistransferase [Candidatus Woesearchaeota archaeon CG10_big_fil_rev_8_21_14_0_10_45_16]|nr:MAG: di-trans,poly-cis-decaprenylcistransferase [Candidatus Woesearchaeota archaeon CG10_big_fil_rev_8_21_14_0_10_45_16]
MENKVKHVGIILDGNRRFAKRLMMQPWKGHELGFEKLKKLFEWCKQLDIRELTLYCFSMQNFNRPKLEFDFLMDIFEKAGNEAAEDENVHQNKIRIKAVGRTHLFPQKVQDALKRAEEATKNYSGYIVNLALAYGGQEEIVDAVKKIGRQIEAGEITDEQITKELIEKNLYLSSQPDLIIRTGGDHRTSNFLIWQSWYSEWFFLEKTWPEFEKEDLIAVIEEFTQRERRFGK